VTPRSEPLLWLQLLALGAIPLELLLLLLLLAGADPGPLPALERLLVWGLGCLGPTLLLWRQPADFGSLLFAQVPLRARTPAQRKLSALQDGLVPRLLGLVGPGLLLPLLWTLDAHAALATAFSPLSQSNRLVVLILAIPLLALLVWQWQQLVQSLWLLSRSEAELEAAPGLDAEDLSQRRLCLGIPLLLLDPLRWPEPAPAAAAEEAEEPSITAVSGSTVAVEPEQASEEPKGSELDEEIG
jgi:hypothetical protein